MNSSKIQTLILGVVLGALVFGQGCGGGDVPAPAAMAAAPAAAGADTVAADANAGAAPVDAAQQAAVDAGFAPKITPPAWTSKAPPVVQVPPPGGLADHVAQIKARFSLKEISGPGLTSEKLSLLDQVCAMFPAGSLRDLSFVFEAAPDGSMFAYGHWESAFVADTGEAPVDGPTPSIYFHMQSVVAFNMVHEIGHHITCLVDTSFGVNLITSLGYTSSAAAGNEVQAKAPWQMNLGQWSATSVQGTSYPTEYSKQSAVEHAAEMITYHFTADGLQDARALSPDFVVPVATQQVIEGKL